MNASTVSWSGISRISDVCESTKPSAHTITGSIAVSAIR